VNFFEHQAAARRTSQRLVLLFVLAVIGIVLAVDAVAWLVVGARMDPGESALPMLAAISLLTAAVIGVASMYRIASLSSGGGDSVAAGLGGRLVPEDTTDPSLRRLRNVVEEMAIASGVPTPRLYVLERDAGINAFAAGYAPADAVVAVTRGAIDRLNRDELQGVIAHEFSHVLNGDMRLNIRLIGVLFGIMAISLIGKKILFNGIGWGGGDRRNSGGIAVVLVAAVSAIIIGSIGMFFARMIKAGVSRSRESLADASAVQFTRQTAGLAGALKKIAGLEAGSRLEASADAEEVSHMLFGEGLKASTLFATHPPILERIRALEPSFSGAQLNTLAAQWRHAPPVGLDEDAHLGFASDAAAAPLRPDSAEVSLQPRAVTAQVARPGGDDYARADAILERMPESLREVATRRDSVMPLLAGLLVDAEEALAGRQHAMIGEALGTAQADTAWRLQTQLLADLHPALRLPLAMLAFPALRQFPRPDIERFLALVDRLVHADDRVSLFEYCLGRLLQVQVVEALDPGRNARFGRLKPGGVKQEFATLLSVVADAGHDDPAAAHRAYAAGLAQVLPRDQLPYAPPSNGVQALDAVWGPLDSLDPLAKQVVVEAVTATIACDGRATVAEVELLRTICGVLHCPLPPMLERAA